MKRINVLVIMVLAASLFLSASVLPARVNTTWSDPVVTTLSGDETYTVSTASPASLAGAFIGNGGYPLPVGFNEGDRQFGGDALIIKNVSFGTELACFAFPTYSAGWRGAIYQWTGSAWNALATSFIDASDGSGVLGCATIFGNGTYALLVYFSPANAPVADSAAVINTSVEDCTMDARLTGWGFGPDRESLQMYVTYPGIVNGVKHTWVIIEAEPVGVFGTLPISGTGTSGSGYVSTGHRPIDPLPTSMLISLRTGSTCHAGLITFHFFDE
jgi:hypothetical protein